MRIALLGGNSYQYAFAPSYAQANGKGYITQDELLGADASGQGRTLKPAQVKALKSDIQDYIRAGVPVPADKLELARQYAIVDAMEYDGPVEEGSRSSNPLDFISNIVDRGADIVSDITAAKRAPARQVGPTAAPGPDNTALIVTSAVAGVALLAVAMRGKRRGRR